MKPPAKGSLVLVKWLDSARFPAGWVRDDTLEHYTSPGLGTSVGWLMSEPGKDVVIVPHRMEIAGEGGGVEFLGGITIPKAAVVSIEKI